MISKGGDPTLGTPFLLAIKQAVVDPTDRVRKPISEFVVTLLVGI